MGEVIYWKEYDESHIVYDPILKRTVDVTGEWVCDDERVEMIAITGSLPPTIKHGQNELRIGIYLTLKNGEEFSEREFVTPETAQSVMSNLISQAEAYLTNLSK